MRSRQNLDQKIGPVAHNYVPESRPQVRLIALDINNNHERREMREDDDGQFRSIREPLPTETLAAAAKASKAATFHLTDETPRR